mgnify:CR=1 FL=1
MREEILRIFPEIGWIEDENLREGVIRTYERALREAARRISKRVRIPGFRPGKAPYEVVRRIFGEEALYNEILDELMRSNLSIQISLEEIRRSQEVGDSENQDPIQRDS